MGDDLTNLPRKLKVVGKTWQPDQDVLLFPDFSWCATAVARVAFVCSLELPAFELQRYAIELVAPEPLTRSIIIERLGIEGPDWLGRYFSDTRLVEINLSRCDHAARELRIGAQSLVYKVLIHELAHFVSHVGCPLEKTLSLPEYDGICDGPWADFASADRDAKEKIAQVACYVYAKAFNHNDLFETLQRLSPRQSPVYNSWQYFAKEDRFWIEDYLKDFARLVYNPRPRDRKRAEKPKGEFDE